MKIIIEISNDDDEKYELMAIAKRHEHIADLNDIYNIARSALKHNADLEAAMEQIKEISFSE